MNKLTIQRREVIQRLSLITGYDVTIVRDVINAETEFVLDEIRNGSNFKLAGAWTFMIKYVAPVLLVVIFVTYTAMQFGLFSV